MTQAELDRGVDEVLIDEETLQARIVELGAEISTDYAGRDLLLVGVLKGAVFFMADLMRELTVPCEIDFLAISSYGAATDSSGVVRILKNLDINVAGRDVLVVEDIIDSGLTLSYLMRNLGARKPASLEVCALLTKPERREIDVILFGIGGLIGMYLGATTQKYVPQKAIKVFVGSAIVFLAIKYIAQYF